MNSQGTVVKVSGPLVVASGMRDANMFDVVHVSDKRLIGEIIEMHGDRASIQVYEETSGLGPGEKVVSTGSPLSVELGPGLIGNMFDGIQRPLETMKRLTGSLIQRGVNVEPLDKEKKWDFVPSVKIGDRVIPGDVLGTVQETIVVNHKIMVPVGVSGTVQEIKQGEYTIKETIAKILKDNGQTVDVAMMQKWPVRVERPYKRKLMPDVPMIVGSRSIDTFFPIAKGGTAAIPGPFGSGKTVVQHSLAKWSDVDIVIYIGCGERGNEMTDVLLEFPELTDPRTGESIMKRTVLIANTSDMPVAAREASIYTGITIGEYFRDMGYHVALIADSTSRWAEALREMSGRLEEMPGEEGYPAYLGSRLAQFYERAGRVIANGAQEREGSLTAVGAVSPPGGDLSEPVTQATLRIVKVFWGLDSELAYKRHFPAINWLKSYSLYMDSLSVWAAQHISEEYNQLRSEAMRLLQVEAELEEIVRLVGIDSLTVSDRLILEAARSIREDYLHQDALDDIDAYASLHKQYLMLKTVIAYYNKANIALKQGVPFKIIESLPVREKIARFRFVPEDKVDMQYETIMKELDESINKQVAGENVK